MSEQSVVLVAEELPFPPSVNDFLLPSIWPWGGDSAFVTKFTVLAWLTAAVLIIFFLVAYRKPTIVPSKTQWMAESVYGFARDGIARDIIGHQGVRFAPYLATLFSFILLNNLWGIIPGVQMSPNSHIAFPAFLAIITWVLFVWVGVRKHGFFAYIKHEVMPPAPAWLYPILIPIEFTSVFIFRPFTLALRLFANMFAGHIILLVFTIGGFVLLNAESVFIRPIALASWAMAIVMTIFELMVIVLQAYVFALLTAVYLQGALADEH